MCGRFSLASTAEEVAEAFGLETTPDHHPRYNVAPSQTVLAVVDRPGENGRQAIQLRWGISSEGRTGRRFLINARSETARRLPTFRESFRDRRCLIAADGFYEWAAKGGRRRQPYYIRRQDQRPFAFAGLWWPAVSAQETGSCVILTTTPNPLLATIHDRMPVILDRSDLGRWLTAAPTDSPQLAQLLRPFPPDALTAFPVGAVVNDAHRDTAECIRPLMV